MDPAWEEMRGAVVAANLGEQLLHLAFGKQVSCRQEPPSP